MTDVTNWDDTVTVETGYGRLAVPKSLMRLWSQYGWPDEQALQEMVRNGSVFAVTGEDAQPT